MGAEVLLYAYGLVCLSMLVFNLIYGLYLRTDDRRRQRRIGRLRRRMESQLNRPLIIRSKGGAKGGQSSLTDDGRDFLSRYNSYVNEVRELANELYAKHFGGVFP